MQIAGVRFRTAYSLHHAQSAAFDAKQAALLPIADSEKSGIPICAHVSAAVISAGAFLEATGNELAENDGRPKRSVKGQPSALLNLNEHLVRQGKTPIPYAHDRWVAAKTLLDLRHRLVHYCHDWLDGGTDNMIGETALVKSDLLPRMKSQFEFLPSPSHYVPWFLSPDCAAWSVNTATSFLDEVFLRLEVDASHDHLRHRIEVERPQGMEKPAMP